MAQDPMRIAWTFPGMGGDISKIDPYMQQLAEGGFNIAQVYDPFYRGTQEWQEQFLTSAEKYGMQGMPYAGWYSHPQELEQLMSRYGDDPRVWGWLNLEEPQATGWTTQEMQTQYSTIKGLSPTKPQFTIFGQSSWNEPQFWKPGGEVLPYADYFGMNIYPWDAGKDLGFLQGRGEYYQTPIRAGMEAGKPFVPLIQAYGGVPEAGIQGQYDIWSGIAGGDMAGLGYYQPAMQNPELLSQMQAMNLLLGGTPYTPPDVRVPPTDGEPFMPPDIPDPYTFNTPGGDTTMAGQYLWGDPYGFNIPPARGWGYADPAADEEAGGVPRFGPADWIYSPAGPGETFPWTRYYAPEALGPMEEHYIPGFPSYRQFPYTPPSPTQTRYQGMQVPGSFFDGVQTPQLDPYGAGQLGRFPTYGGMGTPQLPTYRGGQVGEYPTYSPYGSALMGQTQDVISSMLRGDVGIPERSLLYQQAMGEITEATGVAREGTTKEMERMGRTTSGFAPEAQTRITQTALEAKAGVSRDFAIRTAEMQQQAKQAAAPMAMQLAGMEAGEKARAYESVAQKWGAETAEKIREYEADYRKTEAQYGIEAAQEELKYRSNVDAWGAETADFFKEYQSKIEVATTDYDMRTAQNEMVEAGQERAWQVANQEYTKEYESAKEAGMSDYEAQQFAWQAALQEWQTIYSSIVAAAQQEFMWVAQRRAWSEQRGQIVLGAQQAAKFDVGALLGAGADILSLFV